MSDWGATHDSASDNANSGLDQEMPGGWILIGPFTLFATAFLNFNTGGGVYGDQLTIAVNDGDVSMDVGCSSFPEQLMMFSSALIKWLLGY